MTIPRPPAADRLLTVEAAAERMSTSTRFIRRLISERRIAYVKIGRHVRITEADIAAFIESGRIAPMEASGVWRADRRAS
jgi:excisionase family DNA binding protein